MSTTTTPFRVAVVLVLILLAFLIFVRPKKHGGSLGRSAGDSTSSSEKDRSGKPNESYTVDVDVRCESEFLADWRSPSSRTCSFRMSHGYELPDPSCTPGGINPTVTEEVLKSPRWRTKFVRDCESTHAAKSVVYEWYSAIKPLDNSGERQTCEMDHLIPLELGGADGLGNIWPQCDTRGIALRERSFKVKDRVEAYLHAQVSRGKMSLSEAQHEIADDWTTRIPDAEEYCRAHRGCW